MKKSLIIMLLAVVSMVVVPCAFAGNRGIINSNPQAAADKKYIPGSSDIGGLTSPNNFADRHAWRSGIAGAFVMWRRLFENALPSDEPLPNAPLKKKNPVA